MVKRIKKDQTGRRVRGFKGTMEDCKPEDYRPWISSSVKFHDREGKFSN